MKAAVDAVADGWGEEEDDEEEDEEEGDEEEEDEGGETEWRDDGVGDADKTANVVDWLA